MRTTSRLTGLMLASLLHSTDLQILCCHLVVLDGTKI